MTEGLRPLRFKTPPRYGTKIKTAWLFSYALKIAEAHRKEDVSMFSRHRGSRQERLFHDLSSLPDCSTLFLCSRHSDLKCLIRATLDLLSATPILADRSHRDSDSAACEDGEVLRRAL